ncbi:MAG: glycosyltransferase [Acidimicrobiales bacterium]
MGVARAGDSLATVPEETQSADVTVIMPTRDRHHLLARSLRTALLQRDCDLEIVIIDDGSTVAVTAAPVVGQLLRDPRVRVVRHDWPRGVAVARNSGLAVASSAWVAFLDDDDLWAPDKLSKQLKSVSGDASGWSYTGEVILTEDLQVLSATGAPEAEGIEVRLLQHNAVPGGGSSVLASTTLLRGLGGFDDSFSILADWDMWTRLAFSAPASPVDLPLVGYVCHPGGMSNNMRRSEEEFARIEAKYRERRASREVKIGFANHHLYLAALELRAGRRWPATGHLLKAAVPRPGFRALGLAAITLTWPGFAKSLVRLSERRSRRRCPVGLRHAAESWLAELHPTAGPT